MTLIEILCIAMGLAVSYLIGSMTPSIWIGRIFYNVDVRTKEMSCVFSYPSFFSISSVISLGEKFS